MKKTKINNVEIAGETITCGPSSSKSNTETKSKKPHGTVTVIRRDGSKPSNTITCNGLESIHIGNTFTFGPSKKNKSKHDETKSKQPSSHVTKTTVIRSDGSETIYDGVKNLRIGSDITIGASSKSKHTAGTKSNQPPPSTHSPKTFFSSTVKTGVTLEKVDNFYLNSKKIKEMSASPDHKTFENLDAYNKYHESRANSSSKDNQSEQSSSFKP
jgi:hypothetical protein